MPNNRQWAILIWLAVSAAIFLWNRDVRRSVADVLRTLATPKLCVPMAAMTLYVAGLLVAGMHVGIWTPALATDTAFWFFGSALVLFFQLNQVAKPGFFRRTGLATVELTVFVEFFLNVSVFSLPVELVLQPVLAILFVMAGFTALKPEYEQVRRVLDFVLGVVGIVLVVVVVFRTIGRWGELDLAAQGLTLALPIWLTLGLLPLLAALSLWSSLDHIYVHVRAAAPNWKHTIRGMTAVLLGLGLHPKDLRAFVGFWPQQLARADAFKGARSVVTQFRADRRNTEQEDLERQRLQKQYEGSAAVDGDGRRLDRRGFADAKTSLLTLASFQAGHFKRKGRYATNLEVILPMSMARLIDTEPDQIILNTNNAGDEYWIYAGTPANFYFGVAGRDGDHPTWLYAGNRAPTGGIDTDDWRHVVGDPAHVDW